MIGSCLMIGLKGDHLSQEERDFIIKEEISGVILFKRNIVDFKQLYELIKEIKELPLKKSAPPLLIAVDLEGGLVNRFSHLKESISWPSPEKMSLKNPEEIYKASLIMGEHLKILGFDINFAPVIDLPTVESSLLKTRTFGNKSEEVFLKASSFVKGLLDGGVIPCVKHYPGHGGVKEDSHFELPEDPRSLKELKEQLDLFEKFFTFNPLLIMTAHIVFPQIDSCPASFSSAFLKTELREKRKFSGLIVSDDITMLALEKFSPSERVFKCLQGGCDLILSCTKEEVYQEAIQDFGPYREILDSTNTLFLASEKILKLRMERSKHSLKSWAEISEKVLSSSDHDFFKNMSF